MYIWLLMMMTGSCIDISFKNIPRGFNRTKATSTDSFFLFLPVLFVWRQQTRSCSPGCLTAVLLCVSGTLHSSVFYVHLSIFVTSLGSIIKTMRSKPFQLTLVPSFVDIFVGSVRKNFHFCIITEIKHQKHRFFKSLLCGSIRLPGHLGLLWRKTTSRSVSPVAVGCQSLQLNFICTRNSPPQQWNVVVVPYTLFFFFFLLTSCQLAVYEDICLLQCHYMQTFSVWLSSCLCCWLWRWDSARVQILIWVIMRQQSIQYWTKFTAKCSFLFHGIKKDTMN